MKQLLTLLLGTIAITASGQSADMRVINPDQLIGNSSSTTFSEGTETKLDATQMEEVKRWANYSRSLLVNVERNARIMTDKAQLASYIQQQIQKAVNSSQRESTELLMRYVLNRALVIYDILNRESNDSDVGALDAKVILLEQSVLMAMKYYDHDQTYLSKRNPSNAATLIPAFASFAADYVRFLTDLANSVFDASAQFNLFKLALGLYHWDLYRDNDRLKYADHINRIHDYLESLPQPKTDTEAVQLIRQMKLILKESAVRTAGAEDKKLETPDNPSQSPADGVNLASSTDRSCNNRAGQMVAYTDSYYGYWYIGAVTESFGGSALAVKLQYKNNSVVQGKTSISCTSEINVGFRVGCAGRVCEGRRAMYTDAYYGRKYVATVEYVFNNGMAMIKLESVNGVGASGYMTVTSKDLLMSDGQ